MADVDREFLRQIIVELYDEEVARHPEGIPAEEAMARIQPAVAAVLRSMA